MASEQDRNDRLQSFAADPVGRLPKHNQCLLNSIVIDASPGARLFIVFPPCTRSEKPDGMFPVISGHFHELVEDAGLRGQRCVLISLSHGFD